MKFIEFNMKLKSYVYLLNRFDIIDRVHATSLEHAMVKIEALHGVKPEPSSVMSYADWKSANDQALEPMGLAPWQRALNRQEARNCYPLA